MPALLPSELPVRGRARHHWIVLLAPPGRAAGIALLLLIVAAVIWPTPMAWLLGVVVVAVAALRWQEWRAEQVILTGKRIIRVQGVPETTRTEASLRIDRVSGAQLIQTVPGKVLGYGTIELVAPGEHQSVRRLVRIEDPDDFYLRLRQLIFGEPEAADEWSAPTRSVGHGPGYGTEHVTAPLPSVEAPPRTPFRRRR